VFVITKLPPSAKVSIMRNGVCVQDMREKMWFGVVELLEQERVIEKVELGRENMEDYYTQKELRDKEI
jgi:hypothetical protein